MLPPPHQSCGETRPVPTYSQCFRGEFALSVSAPGLIQLLSLATAGRFLTGEREAYVTLVASTCRAAVLAQLYTSSAMPPLSGRTEFRSGASRAEHCTKPCGDGHTSVHGVLEFQSLSGQQSWHIIYKLAVFILEAHLWAEHLASPTPHTPTFRIRKLSLFPDLPGVSPSPPTQLERVSCTHLFVVCCFFSSELGLKAAGPGIGQGDHLSAPG